MVCREREERLDQEDSGVEWEDVVVQVSLDPRETLVSQDLQDPWGKQGLLDLKDQEVLQGIQDCLEFLGRMGSLALQERGDLQENMDLQEIKEPQVLLDLLDQLGSQVLWESLEYLEPLVFLGSQDALEKLVKKVHLDPMALKEGQGCQDRPDFLVSLVREVCLAFLECLG